MSKTSAKLISAASFLVKAENTVAGARVFLSEASASDLLDATDLAAKAAHADPAKVAIFVQVKHYFNSACREMRAHARTVNATPVEENDWEPEIEPDTQFDLDG